MIVSFIILDYRGVFRFFKQQSYDENFLYPYNGDVTKMAEYMQENRPRFPQNILILITWRKIRIINVCLEMKVIMNNFVLFSL